MRERNHGTMVRFGTIHRPLPSMGGNGMSKKLTDTLKPSEYHK